MIERLMLTSLSAAVIMLIGMLASYKSDRLSNIFAVTALSLVTAFAFLLVVALWRSL